jgi:hypothetical protein
MSKNDTRLRVRVQGARKVKSISDWCAANLEKNEWDLVPVHLFKSDYNFYFNCPKTRIQVILQHL